MYADDQYPYVNAMDAIDCFFPIQLANCVQRANVSTFQNEEEMITVIESQQQTACLPAKCSEGSLELIGKVEIGGLNIDSTPGTVEPGSIKTHRSRDRCEEMSTAESDTVPIVECLPSLSIGMLQLLLLLLLLLLLYCYQICSI